MRRGRRFWEALGAIGAALFLLTNPARANEASQALSARALIALNADQKAEALAMLDRAVEADPDDAEVRYQRGVVRARSGDTNGAIEDLQRALELKPYFPTAALELGIALVDADRAGDAEAPLVQAQQVPALDAQASFYLALAELRLGRYELARTNFARARERDPSLTTATQYYEGVIAFRRRDYDAAEQQFTTVQRENPETPMGRESAQYLTVIADARASDYSAFGTMALEYDSNVTLGPNQTVPGSVSGQGDGRFVVNLGGRWTPVRFGRFSASVAYEFFQSAQFELSDFNLTDNRPAMQLQYDFDWISVGLLGRYDYYLLGGESYLSEATGMPWVTIREEGFGRTEIYAQPFPGPGGVTSVSTAGGTLPRWRNDGKELFYIGLDDWVTAVPILGSDSQSLRLGAPARLFPSRMAYRNIEHTYLYAVANDGQRFLIEQSNERGTATLTVVRNWQAANKATR